MANDPGGFQAAERARLERVRTQRANSRQASAQRRANPMEFERDNLLAGVAYRFAAKTKDAANDHRAARGQGTENLTDTERRAIRIAARWKKVGVTDEQLNRIESLSKDQIIARATPDLRSDDDNWDMTEAYGDDTASTILYYND